MYLSLLQLAVVSAGFIKHVSCLPAGSHGDGTLSASRQSSASPTSTKEAIILTDAKLDDKMAMYYLDQSGQYRQLHVILNGVQDQEAAHGSMKDFRKKMHDQATAKGHSVVRTPMIYYEGRNPLQSPAPHENFFVGEPEMLQNDQSDIAENFEPNSTHVDVFHIGPTFDEDIQTIIDAVHGQDKSISLLHSTAGYNNSQQPEYNSNGKAERKHIQNLHRKDLNARTVLIQTKTTFNGPQGGTQPYDWLQQRVPQDHLDPSGKDEWFHLAQLRHADQVIEQHTGRQANDIEQLPYYDDDQVMQFMMWRGRLKSLPEDEAMSEMLVHIFQERQQMLRDLQHGDRGEYDVLIARLGAAIAGFTDHCQAETCDANHIAVVLDAHNEHPHRFVHAHAESHRNIRRARKEDPVHGYTLLNQSISRTRELLDNVFHPIFDPSSS